MRRSEAKLARAVVMAVDASFEEGKHPRGEGGKFSAGPSARPASKEQHAAQAGYHHEMAQAHAGTREKANPNRPGQYLHAAASNAHVEARRAHQSAAEHFPSRAHTTMAHEATTEARLSSEKAGPPWSR
jgi:hypothetical protein